MKGKVYLVGAGPGDYKLLTLKGLECVQKADVIVYDRLANENYLKEAKPNCEFIYVGKASSNHTLPQEDINRVIADKAKEGKIVTRLKGGDPYVFGRGGEEGELLREEGIEFEVVPGITSAIGGLCYAGIPITHRDYASSFHVITGHLREDDKENPEINWNALANTNGTLVFLMGVANLQKISSNLIKEGKSKDTPVALISWATRYNQRVVISTLENVYETAIKEGVKPPTLIVVGEVVGLRDKLNFFENKPLFSKRVIVTRSRTQSSSLVEKISDLGGNPIEIPTIKIDKIENNIELENEINNIKDYTYLVLTSKNGVDIFFDKLDEMGLDSRALANLKVCAIGSATAKEIKNRGIKADIVPEKFVAEYLFEELKPMLKSTDKVLMPRAKNARDYLVDKIGEICEVKEIHTYETVVDSTRKDEVLELLDQDNADYITFASSSTVKNFVEIIGEENIDKLNNIKVISIGPITTQTIKELGLNLYKEAEVSTIDGMISTIIEDK
ncbi:MULTISPECIES: uroporphyrinogen-III C-methyltransferase [Romboutsia]|uniref:uroporphyrinogen-III C-methyltransferase n=1 Tax=Romboutsia hominis TaxID=1507512 RepID=A0A2P2BUT7_9FIRM|nr:MULTISPECIES: uroporphyrinogen-III C-methyltransferase [Romboutsia]MCH1959088.1 uroporphyrinogen-III C-methyltransferase [Romboutsia hominis]MCH1968208.1 uroporphyrinogen-III C-methyltransferase [Romboutsia hominis]MDB8791214.1 uroporphyrinogen-III C-methyltransferase [Romboutsia sp. 1001216sp1]MDB8794783.1 uroporphyrinogen-III C-methyltransferase [Romboutsia sp. 1001216sp1]MDB8797632.1 uroporphyrinogen-III C-methyltransferase [Romboutsia sp. 1001216sp1]